VGLRTGSFKDTLVKCNECGKELWVSFDRSMRKGWPKCCGLTMELITTSSDIESSVDQIMRKPKVRLRSKYSEKRYIP